jgi:hypothetical protein
MPVTFVVAPRGAGEDESGHWIEVVEIKRMPG